MKSKTAKARPKRKRNETKLFRVEGWIRDTRARGPRTHSGFFGTSGFVGTSWYFVFISGRGGMSTKDMTTVLGRVAVTTCFVIVGFASRRFGLLRREDGEVMLTFVVNVTLPAMLLHTLVNTRALFGPGVPLVMLCSVFATVLVAGAGALVYRRTPAYEKGLLTGALCGANVSTFALPFVEAVWGMEGLRLAALFDVPNLVVVFALGAAVFAFHQRKARLHAKSAAARHDDGGVYHGEWSSVGESKQGVGVYEYPSGASYEGQWNNNQKEGFGVYKFAKGGSYAGGFKRGSFHGTGLRFMRSGGVKSGRFQDGDFVEALSLKAADDATVAATTMAKKARAKAAVSKTTETHGAFWTRVVLKTLSFPPVVAISVVVFLTATGQNLPALVTQVLNPLALANSPLVLLSLGTCCISQIQRLCFHTRLTLSFIYRKAFCSPRASRNRARGKGLSPFITFRLPDCPYSYQKGIFLLTVYSHTLRETDTFFFIVPGRLCISW